MFHALRPDRSDVRMAFGELGLTTVFMFIVFSAVSLGIGTASAGASALETRVRCAVVSMFIGLVIVGFVLSRPGRWTGAHMNPAITLSLWVAGRTPRSRVLPYLAAQLIGAIAAAALSRAAWGATMSATATCQPAGGYGAVPVALAEGGVFALIVWVICRFQTRWLPWLVGLMFGLQGAVLGTFTGGSVNPARQLGPALISGQTHLLAIYLIAPTVAGMLAAWVAGSRFAGRVSRRTRYCERARRSPAGADRGATGALI